MEDLLQGLRAHLVEHVREEGAVEPLGDFGVFFCRRVQNLRSVPIVDPTAVLIINGSKTLLHGSEKIRCGPGELLFFPGDTTVALKNDPCPERGDYLALGVSFSPSVRERFGEEYRELFSIERQNGGWRGTAPNDFLLAVLQWLQWNRNASHSKLMTEHRHVELLLLLAQSHLAAHILRGAGPSWRQRVANLLSSDLECSWQMEDVCKELALSEASLRRNLSRENTSFRKTLEEVRLLAGLSLLQETDWSVIRVAESVGYGSQSRFTERFKMRFGLTPSALRQTKAQ